MSKRIVISLASVLIGCFMLSSCAGPFIRSGKERTAKDPETTSESSKAATSKIDKIDIPEEGCPVEFPDGEVYDYVMDLKFDPDEQTVGGHVIFTFFNDSEDPWNELCMRDYPSLFDDMNVYVLKVKDGGGITRIENITDSRTGALEYERDPDDKSVIWIKLGKPLEAGEHMTLTYDFLTLIPTNPDRFGAAGGIYNITNFYPILAEYVNGSWSHERYFNTGECFYSEISDYHVTIEAPEGSVFASTGEEISSVTEGGWETVKFEAPFVRDFVFSASEFFEKKTEDIEGVKVNVFYSKDKPAQQDMTDVTDKCFDVAGTSLKAFGEAFGRYPYGELDIVLSPLKAGGMEYPNLVIITNEVCHEYISVFEPYDQLENCLCHEIGHQWFMGIVGSNSGAEPWLDESVTSYTELVYYEYLGGKVFDDHVAGYRRMDRDLSEVDRDKEREEGILEENISPYLDVPYSNFPTDLYYTAYIYDTGKAFCYQLEEACGREEFHGVLRAYVHRYAFKNATTKDFLEVLYGCAGQDNGELNRLVATMLKTRI